MKQKKDSKIKKKFIEVYANFVTDDLMWILENWGESTFRLNARYFYLTEKTAASQKLKNRCLLHENGYY